jgi:hypothetical protein
MNRRQALLNEIRAVLQPKDEYFIRMKDTGLFYKSDCVDLSIGRPLPGCKGKSLEKSDSEIFSFGNVEIYF